MKFNAMLAQYNAFIKEQERKEIIRFINLVIADLALFGDDAKDYKALVEVLESEEWVLG